MNICCCALAGTKTCLICHNSFFNDNGEYGWHLPKNTKTIEKFDEKGNLIERITE